MAKLKECPACDGTGRTYRNTTFEAWCPHCHGDGQVVDGDYVCEACGSDLVEEE